MFARDVFDNANAFRLQYFASAYVKELTSQTRDINCPFLSH